MRVLEHYPAPMMRLEAARGRRAFATPKRLRPLRRAAFSRKRVLAHVPGMTTGGSGVRLAVAGAVPKPIDDRP